MGKRNSKLRIKQKHTLDASTGLCNFDNGKRTTAMSDNL